MSSNKPIYDLNEDWEEISKSMSDKSAKPEADAAGSKAGFPYKESILRFNLKPEELESYLNKYIVGQEEAVEIIATKVCTHFNRMEIEKSVSEDERIVGNIKSNMLLIGPTGVGKTYIIKLIAKKLGVPFVKADATKFSETGYVGGDVEDLVRELVHEADGDIAKAEYGIIYLDEIDKIASSGNTYGPDVSRTGVQRNLLKLMEEAEVDLKTPHDLASQVEAAMEAQKTGKVTRKKINTRNILFIVSGAFNTLEEMIRKRLNMQSIGFDKNHTSNDPIEGKKNILKEVRTEDLISYGFESEFIGRLPVIVLLNELDEDGLYKILKNKYSSVVLGKKLDFKAYGIDLDFTNDALKILANKAYKEKTGARGLLSVFENALIKFEKTLPSTNITELMVSKEIVESPDKELQKILLMHIEDDIKKYQRDFLVSHGIFLEFEKDAVEAIKEIAFKNNKSIKQICNDSFHEYHFGIKLMEKDSFTITRDAVLNPNEYLNNYIRNNYKKASAENSQAGN